MRYGALPSERNREIFWAVVVGCSITFGVLIGIPALLNFLFSWNISFGLGVKTLDYIGWGTIIGCLIGCLLDFYLETHLEYRKKRKERIVCCYYDKFQKENKCIEVEK